MSINLKKVKEFWDSRAKKMGSIPIESVTNLEEDTELMNEKVSIEQEKVSKALKLSKEMTLLDLGAGIGNWSIFFSPHIKEITAVEYSMGLIEIGQKRLREKNIHNIKFEHSPAQDFLVPRHFDVIFISGLFVYLNDDEAKMVVKNIRQMSQPNTVVCLRDGTGIKDRFEINDKPSDYLNAPSYSAIYRSSEEYIQLFKNSGFNLVSDEDMFPNGSRLNKYPETRLRIYTFNLS